MINKKLFLKYIKNPEKFKLKIKPRCLTFDVKAYHKPAAYTSDGFMLPCCWLDEPKNDFGVKHFGLKDEHLRVRNVEKLEEIFKSEEWAHFFDTLLNDQKHAMKHCKYKCGNLKREKSFLKRYQKSKLDKI